MPEGAAVYTKLYFANLKTLRRKLRRRGLSYDKADPLAAEILNSVLKRTPFSHPQFDSRLKRRTRDRLASYFRNAWDKRRESLPDGVLASLVESPVDGRVVDLVHDVRWGVSGLSQEAQIVARMHLQDGRPLQEVAEVLGKSVSAVKSLAHRTRRLLKRRLAHRWYRGRWWPAG
jgi:DNA-directed RNA polymerase specialized sigma24 family protein